MRPFLFRQIAQQLAQTGVRRHRRRLFVKAANLQFHGARLFAHHIEPKRLIEPHRAALDEASYIIAADQGNVLAELPLVKLEQSMAVARLLLAHAFEHLGRSGIILPQSFGKIGVNTRVFLFQLNRQRQNFLLGEALKISHRFPCSATDGCRRQYRIHRRHQPVHTINGTALLAARPITQAKLQVPTEIAMAVALDGEGDVQQLARRERIGFEPAGHPPSERVDGASQA